jgi:osmotically-inducible protein OsmY
MKPTYTSAVVVAVAEDNPPERIAREELDDPLITALIKLALVSHRSTSRLKTSVHTQDGIVTLTGVVRNQAEKDLVTEFVQDVRGVRTAKNNMTIEGAVSHSISDK